MSTEAYCKYLEGYTKEFGLDAHIHLNTSVTKVERAENDGHVIFYVQDGGKESSWSCDAVAVCSGLHVTPNIPHFEGIENVPIVMHSSEFKGKEQFGADKDILIIGSGETGME